MKDLKIVLLIALPVALAAGVLWVLEITLGPATPSGREGGPDGAVVTRGSEEGGKPRAPKAAIPESQWPRVKAPHGNDKLVATGSRTPHGGGPDVLSVDELKKLVAENTPKSWKRIEFLLRYGALKDPEGVERILVQALGKGGNLSAYAARVLPFLKGDELRRDLTANLLSMARSSTDPDVLKAAFLVVGEIGTGRDASDLASIASSLDGLGTQQGREAARAAVLALGRIKAPEAADELARLLSSNQSTDLTPTLLEAISRVSTPAMVSALTPLLSSSSPSGLRLLAVKALGLTKSPAAEKPIEQVYDDESDRGMKEAAIVALGRIGDQSATEKLVDIHEQGGALAFEAGLSLSQSRSAQPILHAIDGETDDRVKVCMEKALGNAGGKAATAKLTSMLSSDQESASVRGTAARSLSKLGDPAAVGPMVQALSDTTSKDQNLRLDLIFSLQELARVPKARQDLVDHALPELQKIADKPNRRDPVYYYALRTIRVIKEAAAKGDARSSSQVIAPK